MTRHMLTLAALFALAGCAPETRTREVDRPDVAPMDLPEFGWHMTWTRVVTDSNGEEFTEGPNEFDCYIRQSSDGTALDVCGFTASVGADAFSFDVKPYRAESWYYGILTIEIEGAGDMDGSEISVRAEAEDGYWYRLEYTNVHEWVL